MSPSMPIAAAPIATSLMAIVKWMRIDLSEFRYGQPKGNFSVRQSVRADTVVNPGREPVSLANPIELGLTVEVGFVEDDVDEPYGAIKAHGFGQFSYFDGKAAERDAEKLRFLEQSGYAILYGHISDSVNQLMRGAGEGDFWLPHLSRENFAEDAAGDDGSEGLCVAAS